MGFSDPVKVFEWWHEAVFGNNPTRSAIPHKVLRDYLDYLWWQDYKRKLGIS